MSHLFDEIIESYINGQKVQCVRQFKELSNNKKQDFIESYELAEYSDNMRLIKLILKFYI